MSKIEEINSALLDALNNAILLDEMERHLTAAKSLEEIIVNLQPPDPTMTEEELSEYQTLIQRCSLEAKRQRRRQALYEMQTFPDQC